MSARPSLGSTVDAVLRAWQDRSPRGNCQSVVGVIVCGGGRYEWRSGVLWRTFPPRPDRLATAREATRGEVEEVEEAVRKGWLQITDEPVTGVQYGERRTAFGTLVLHQATGRTLED